MILGSGSVGEDYERQRTFRRAGPQRVLSGAGSSAKIFRAVEQLGASRALLVTGPTLGRSELRDQVEQALGDRGIGSFTDCSQHAPSAAVRALSAAIAETETDVVVALGGSSVSDCVKLALWTLSSQGTHDPLPYVAVPTTLSAGEFTGGAGYVDPRDGTKRTITDPRLVASCVILDPRMTVLTPDRLWTSTAMKAVEHAVEALWSRYAHPVVDAQALRALRILGTNLDASRDVAAGEARAACQIAAWMSIAGVSTGGLRLSHVIGHQIGAHWEIPHGITSAVLLPTVMRFLAPKTLSEQSRVAAALGVDVAGRAPEQVAVSAARAVEELAESVDLPTRLGATNAVADEIDLVARASVSAATALGLTEDLPQGADDVAAILRQAW